VGDVPIENPVRYAMEHWREIRPDLIHAQDFEAVQIGLMLKTAFKVPLIVTVHKVPKRWDPTLPQRDPKDCFLQVMLDLIDCCINNATISAKKGAGPTA
jgi:hypothetical protein